MNRVRPKTSGLIIRSLRVWSGLFMLAFVTTHLLNLSLGVRSIEAMTTAAPFLTGIWSNMVMGVLLLTALVIHFFLGLWALYRRPTLRTNTQDLVQLFSGLAVVPLMATHVVGVASLRLNDVPFDYAAAIKLFWLDRPEIGLLQVVLLSVIWIHGCAGLFTWLRSKSEMRHVLGWLYPLAVAVPVLALVGYAEAGRGALITPQPAPSSYYSAPTSYASPAAPRIPYEVIEDVTNNIIWWSLALAALTLAARAARVKLQPYENVIIQRGDGLGIETSSQLSVFDSFRTHDQPHAGLCDARGRCGTCAIRILSSEFPLPDPTALEIKTLSRIGAGEDVRLACQLTPAGGNLIVDPLYPADYTFKDQDQTEPHADHTEAQA